jgi:hypothetical protein
MHRNFLIAIYSLLLVHPSFVNAQGHVTVAEGLDPQDLYGKCHRVTDDLQHHPGDGSACAMSAAHQLKLSKLFSEGKKFNGFGDEGSTSQRGLQEYGNAGIELMLASAANSFYMGDSSMPLQLAREQAQQSLSILRKAAQRGYASGSDQVSLIELSDELILARLAYGAPTSLAAERAMFARCRNGTIGHPLNQVTLQIGIICQTAATDAEQLNVQASKSGDEALKEQLDLDAAQATMLAAVTTPRNVGFGYASLMMQIARGYLSNINNARARGIAKAIKVNAARENIPILPDFSNPSNHGD